MNRYILVFVYFSFLILSACSYGPPLIEDEIVKVTVECEDGDIVVIDDLDTIEDIIKEVNNSKRETTADMDLYIEHSATIENKEGEKKTLNLYSTGRSLFAGYYIYSDIEDFCGK